tara:strand:- start:184 stop:567 length:384 start_codon:yes stop_codon:yes gene_type:complete
MNAISSDKNRTKRNIFIVLGIFAILFSGAFYYTNKLAKNLDNNGIKTSAIITNIQRNNYRMNDMDGTWVRNRFITYQFQSVNGLITGTYEVRDDEFLKYFHGPIKTGDSLKIKYDPKNPSNSKISEK